MPPWIDSLPSADSDRPRLTLFARTGAPFSLRLVHPATRKAKRCSLLPPLVRCSSCLIGLSILVLLIVAARLEPNPRGLGTHQQLGLPPCTMRVVLEIRCPACGMTTSWAHFVRGQWLSSASVNLGGFLLALYGLGLLLGCARVCWTGSLPKETGQQWATLGLLAIAMVTMVDWAGRLLAERL